jgi:hypothetical protein
MIATVARRATKGCRNSAEVCRANKWKAGTRLVGDEGSGPTVIEITAVGESGLLAKAISHNGKKQDPPREGSWTLSNRDWKEPK